MKVFIGWSGKESGELAQLVVEWLPRVIQRVEPFLSQELPKGERWAEEIARQLADAGVGIICLNATNSSDPWINYEAGVMSASRKVRVCPLLFNFHHTELKGPLSLLQGTEALKKEEMQRLVRDVNDQLVTFGEPALQPKILDDAFNMHWQSLETKFQSLLSRANEKPPPQRTDHDLLVEMLDLVRGLARTGLPTMPTMRIRPLTADDFPHSLRPIERHSILMGPAEPGDDDEKDAAARLRVAAADILGLKKK